MGSLGGIKAGTFVGVKKRSGFGLGGRGAGGIAEGGEELVRLIKGGSDVKGGPGVMQFGRVPTCTLKI